MIQQGPECLAASKTGMAAQSGSPYDERFPSLNYVLNLYHYLAVRDYENHIFQINFLQEHTSPATVYEVRACTLSTY